MQRFLTQRVQATTTTLNPAFFTSQQHIFRPAACSLTQIPQFNLRVRQTRDINYEYENERKAFKKEFNANRKEQREKFWDLQTQIENKTFMDHKRERFLKQHADMMRWRHSIIRISKHTQREVARLEKRHKQRLDAMKIEDIKNMRRGIENKLMLDLMQMECDKYWPTLANVNQRIETEVIIPQTILNFGEYQTKLQKLALFAEQGNMEAMQNLLDNQGIIEKKNVLLQPIFRDLKSQIRHMTFTPEFQLIREYMQKKRLIESTPAAQASQAHKKKMIGELRKLYSTLLRQREAKIQSDLSLRLKVMEERLHGIFEMLLLWTRYVDIIYMPETELNLAQTMARQDDQEAVETSYTREKERNEQNKRLEFLFGDSESVAKNKKNLQKERDQRAEDEEYMTVNEDETTDTSSGVESDAAIAATNAYELQLKQTQEEELEALKVAKDEVSAGLGKRKVVGAARKEDEEKKVAEGIVSSSEESESEVEAAEQVKEEPVAEQAIVSETQDLEAEAEVEDAAFDEAWEKIESFGNSSKFFQSDEQQDFIEHSYGFSPVKVEEFMGYINSKLDIIKEGSASQTRSLTDDYEEQNFVGDESLRDELNSLDQQDMGDMSSLNIFGVSIDATSVSKNLKGSKKNKGQMENLLNDLVMLTQQADPTGTTKDFTKRKSFVSYDPYNPNLHQDFIGLRYDNNPRTKASLVIDMHSKSIVELGKEMADASMQERQSFERIVEMLERLREIKIVDPQILRKLIDLYRYKVADDDYKEDDDQ